MTLASRAELRNHNASEFSRNLRPPMPSGELSISKRPRYSASNLTRCDIAAHAEGALEIANRAPKSDLSCADRVAKPCD